MPSRRFGEDDSAVSEIMGFVLMFALSAIVLVSSVQTFATSKENADSVVAGVELRGIANRVSARVVQSALLAEDFPNATMTIQLRIPTSIKEQPYRVYADDDTNGNRVVKTITLNEDTAASASTFNVAKTGATVTGDEYSSDGALVVTVCPGDRYWDPASGSPGTKIQIKGVTDPDCS